VFLRDRTYYCCRSSLIPIPVKLIRRTSYRRMLACSLSCPTSTSASSTLPMTPAHRSIQSSREEEASKNKAKPRQAKHELHARLNSPPDIFCGTPTPADIRVSLCNSPGKYNYTENQSLPSAVAYDVASIPATASRLHSFEKYVSGNDTRSSFSQQSPKQTHDSLVRLRALFPCQGSRLSLGAFGSAQFKLWRRANGGSASASWPPSPWARRSCTAEDRRKTAKEPREREKKTQEQEGTGGAGQQGFCQL